MNYDSFIGNEAEFSFEHRVLNTILVYGIGITALAMVMNYLLVLGPVIVGISGVLCFIFGILYYLSMIKKKYRLARFCVVFLLVFITTPVMWITNGGLSGGSTFFILTFSSTIAILLRGYPRIAMVGCLALVTLGLIVAEYWHPLLISGYNSDFARYADVSCGLLISIIVNTALFIVIINHYIDEHKRANQYLAEMDRQKIESLNRQFGRVFNASPALMAIYREKDDVYLAVNDAWLASLGFERREIIGLAKDQVDILLPEERQLDLSELTLGTLAEIKVRTKQGEVRDWLVSKAKIQIDGQDCILLSAMDRTVLNNMERKIAHLDRLNLVGEIAASIGHEIRNPLTTVRGFLQIFQGRNEYARDKENIEVMITELDRANSIITEFLSLAKNRLINLKSNNLNRTIEGLYPLIYAAALLEGKEIFLELAPDILSVLADENEIRQLILNLTRNAIEAVSKGGKVTISTRLDGKYVVLAVKDTGGGISAEIYEKLGMPFLTTKENGTGLGLAVCYRIVQRHNARMEVITGAGGTTFCVRFSKQTGVTDLRD